MTNQVSDTSVKASIILENMLHGYSLQKIITDENDKAIDFVFVEVNERFEEILGIKRKDIIGKEVSKMLPTGVNDEIDWISFCADIAHNNKKHQEERYVPTFDKWLLISLFSPKKNYFVTLIDDITSRKATENELQRAVDVVKNIQIGLHIYHLEDIDDDTTLRMVYANPITELYTGVAPKDIIGKTLDENFPGLREKNIPQQYARVVRTQEPITMEDVYYGDDRVIQGAFSVKAFPLPDNHVGISFENITERKKSEQKLVNNQEFIERILNTSTNIIYIYDLVKKTNVFSNRNIVENLGFTSKEIKDMGDKVFTLLLHPDDAELVVNHHLRLSKDTTGRIYELTYRMKNKEGDWIWLFSRDIVFQRNENGNVTQILGTAVDITDRKRNEEKIQILEKFAESSTQGFAIGHLDRKLYYLNPAMCEILGVRNSQETIGKEFTNFIPEKLHSKVEKEIFPNLISKGFWTGESMLKSLQGKEIHTFEDLFLIKDEKGNPQFIAAIINDITEQKKIEKELDEHRNHLEDLVEKRTTELKQSEQKFKALFYDNQSVMLLINSKTYEIVDANQAACNYYKYSHEQITKKTITQINTLSDKKIELEVENVRTQKRNYFVFKHKLANNEIRDVEVYSGKVIIEEKELLYSIVHDITERIKAQEALKQSEEKFRTLAESSPTGIAIMTTDKYFYVNEAWVKLTGHTIEEALKMSPMAMVHPKEKEKVRKRSEARFRGEEVVSRYDLRIVTKTNEVKWIDMSITSIDYEGQPASLIVFNEITELKKTEKALRDSETELKQLNAQKDRFFSIIAHDLKGPIAALQQLSAILFKRKDNLKPGELEKLTNFLNNSSRTAHDLLNNLLIWSRSQLNKIVIEPEILNIRDLSQETIKLLAEKSRTKEITIEDKIPDFTFVSADKNSLLTVFRNLISNAINHTYRGGNVTIEISRIENGYKEVKITDTGVGITKEKINKLFKIDEDISTAGTENEKGTGLGLILCKDFVERNGGEIWVESDVNKGSSFYFTVPRAES